MHGGCVLQDSALPMAAGQLLTLKPWLPYLWWLAEPFFGGFPSQAGTSFTSVDEECTIGPLKKVALGSGSLRTCDGLSSTILPGLVRNVAHTLSEGVKHTHGPNSKQKHGQAWETPTDSGTGRWVITAVPGSSHRQHSLSLESNFTAHL